MTRKREKPIDAANTDLTGEALQRLTEVQRGAQVLFQREANRLARKHGVSDPRAQRFLTAAEGAGTTLRALEIARESQPTDVQPEQDGAVIHGRVSTRDGGGAADIEVMLEDTNGRVMRAAGSATTDENGRYALRIAPEVASRLAGKEYVLIGVGKTPRGKDDLLYRATSTFTIVVNTVVQFDFKVELPLAQPRPTPDPRPAPEPGKPDPTPKPPRPRPDDEPFIVRGQVMNAEGRPAAGLLVRVYDKDVRYDDLIGAALTGRKGDFTVQYRARDFSEGEQSADLYFVVVNAGDETLLSTANGVIFNAERETRVELKLEK